MCVFVCKTLDWDKDPDVEISWDNVLHPHKHIIYEYVISEVYHILATRTSKGLNNASEGLGNECK